MSDNDMTVGAAPEENAEVMGAPVADEVIKTPEEVTETPVADDAPTA